MFGKRSKGSLLYAKIVPSNEVPQTIKWLIKRKVVRTAGQANLLLLLVIVGASLTAYTIFPSGDSKVYAGVPFGADEIDFHIAE